MQNIFLNLIFFIKLIFLLINFFINKSIFLYNYVNDIEEYKIYESTFYQNLFFNESRSNKLCNDIIFYTQKFNGFYINVKNIFLNKYSATIINYNRSVLYYHIKEKNNFISLIKDKVIFLKNMTCMYNNVHIIITNIVYYEKYNLLFLEKKFFGIKNVISENLNIFVKKIFSYNINIIKKIWNIKKYDFLIHNFDNNKSISLKKKIVSLNKKPKKSKISNVNLWLQFLLDSVFGKDFIYSQWFFPVKGPIKNYILFKKNNTYGINIYGYKGQSILSTSYGQVKYIGNTLQGYGNLIVIKHGKYYLSAYAHNEIIYVKVNELVFPGQKIASMGSSGTNINKLYFSLYYKDLSVNPLQYFAIKSK